MLSRLYASFGYLLIGVASVFVWALLLVVSRILLIHYQFDPWLFTFIQLISAGCVLMIGSAGHKVDWQSLRRVSTWIYAVFRVIASSATTVAIVYASVFQVGLLTAINVPIAMLAVWLCFSRAPACWELAGHLLIVTAITVLISRLEDGISNPVLIWVLISELAVVSAALIAEKHPDNNAGDPAARLRFTGIILLITAGFFLIWRTLQISVGGLPPVMADGRFDPILDGRIWIAGCLVGIALRGPAMHLSLKAIRVLGADLYLIMLLMLPLAGWLLESTAGWLGLLVPADTGIQSYLISLTIVSGGILIVVIRRKNRTVL